MLLHFKPLGFKSIRGWVLIIGDSLKRRVLVSFQWMLSLPSLKTHFGEGLVQPHLTCLTYSCLRLLILSLHCIQVIYIIHIVVSQLQYKEWLTMVVAMTLYENLSHFLSLPITIYSRVINTPYFFNAYILPEGFELAPSPRPIVFRPRLKKR